MKKILAICGSTRKSSTNEAILKGIATRYHDQLNVQLYTSLDKLPHFNPDIDDSQVAESVREFRELVNKSDGVIICTPEYVFSLPGALKNALEWTVSTTVFTDKPVALIVASGVGEKTYESLSLVMRTIGAAIGEDSAILIQGARSRFNEKGDPTEKNAQLALEKMMSSFIRTLERTIAV